MSTPIPSFLFVGFLLFVPFVLFYHKAHVTSMYTLDICTSCIITPQCCHRTLSSLFSDNYIEVPSQRNPPKFPSAVMLPCSIKLLFRCFCQPCDEKSVAVSVLWQNLNTTVHCLQVRCLRFRPDRCFCWIIFRMSIQEVCNHILILSRLNRTRAIHQNTLVLTTAQPDQAIHAASLRYLRYLLQFWSISHLACGE